MPDRFGHIPIQPPESSPPVKKPTKKPATIPGPVPAKARKNSPNKVWGWTAALVVIAALYAALGLLGVPYYFTKVLPSNFHEKTGLVLEPGTVTFNPFTFRFAAGDLRILSQSGSAILSLRSVLADLAPVSVFRLGILCKAVEISGLDLDLAREPNGSYNFHHIFGAGKNETQSAMFNFTDLPILFSLNNISVADSRITFNDAPAGKIHTIEKVQLDLPTLANIPFQTDQYLRPHFSAVVNGSPVELTGQTGMGGADDQVTRLSLNVHDLDLTIYSGYLPINLPMQFTKGAADGKVAFVFDPQDKSGDKLSIGFQLRISEAELIKENKSTTITIPTARLNGDLLPISRRLHFTEIAVREPTVNSFGKFLKENGKSPVNPAGHIPSSGKVDAAAYELNIDLLVVDKAIVRFFPEKNDTHPGSTWSDIQVSVKDYHFAPKNVKDRQNASFRVSGEKDGSPASFSWQGTISSTESLTGSLNLLKMDCNYLFTAISSDPPFELRGSTDLRGQLNLSAAKDPEKLFSYTLVDAEVTVEDFALLEKERNILAAKLVKLAPLSLDDKAVNFGNVQFQQGRAQFAYGRFPELFATFTAQNYQLQGIDFDGRVTFSQPEKPDQPLTFSELSLKANQLDSAEKTADNLSLAGKTETGGGILKAQGELSLRPFSLAVKAGFRDLPAIRVWPFFTASPAINGIGGNLSGQGLFQLPNKSFDGELQLTDVSGKGPGKTIVSWQKSVLRDVDYTAAPFHLGMGGVEIDQGRFSWEITRKDNGPMQYLANLIKFYLPAVGKQSSIKPVADSSPVDIKEISIKKSRIKMHDHRLTPEWQGDIVDFAGKISDLNFPAAKGKSVFSFTGKLDDAPFTINGEMDLFSQAENGTLRFSLDTYPLASFYQQLAAKTDLDTSKGEFKLKFESTWQNNLYTSSGNLTLINLEPGATSELAVPLALLTDPEGTLQLPFNFSRKEPVAEVTLLDELLTTFQTKIIKGSVAPLLLAGEDFSDLVGNELIEFQPGVFMISAAGRTVLSRYAALLAAHPRVGLVLSGGVDKETDSQAMVEQLTALEQERVALENEKLMRQWQEQKTHYQNQLAEQQKTAGPGKKIVEQDIPADILTGFTPLQPVPIVIDQAMLLELAQKRLNIVYDYFTTELALQPGRISMVVPENLDGPAEASTSGVSISLKAISR